MREVLAAAEAVVGHAIPSTAGPRRPGDPPVLVARADRALEVLGWRPAHPSLEEIVGSAWAWRLAHPDGYSRLTGQEEAPRPACMSRQGARGLRASAVTQFTPSRGGPERAPLTLREQSAESSPGIARMKTRTVGTASQAGRICR